MPEWFKSFAEWLDPLGVVVGLLSSVPIFLTWWEIFVGRNRRERRWLRQIRRESGSRPAILVVDLLPGKDAFASVENFRLHDEALRSIPRERVFRVQRDTYLTPDDMSGLAREIRATMHQVLANATDVLHYFHAGPAISAALVGAELSNGCRVMLYQFEQGTYINFGPLDFHRLLSQVQ